MEKPAIPSSSLTDLETAAKQDLVILHAQEDESTHPGMLLASRATLSAQSSVLAAPMVEATSDGVRLQVAASSTDIERLYTVTLSVAMTFGGGSSPNGTHECTLALITSDDVITTLPLAVRFGAAGVVGCLVEGVLQAPSMGGICAVDQLVQDDGVLGGFEWGPRSVDVLVKQCLPCW